MTIPHSLDYTLNAISHVFHILTPFDVIPYAYQDPHGGYHSDHADGFPIGSMWRVEGQMLYALIRALKPQSVLELGTSRGCSATHMLQALRDNGSGILDCVDNGSQVASIGDMIPIELCMNAFVHRTNVEEFIPLILSEGRTYDFILEDAMHSIEQVQLVWENADKLLNRGGMIVSHDACHAIVGPDVQRGIAAAGYLEGGGWGGGNSVMNVLIEPADCGFALWRKAL